MINLILILLTLACVIPLLLLIMSSFTEEKSLIQNGYSLFPRKFSVGAYRYILTAGNVIVKAYGITVLTTAIGTTLNIFLTLTMAYPLSRKDMAGRNILAFFVFFTMLFNGGLVPTYMMWTQVFKIRDTLWAQIFPSLLLGAFNIIMMRSFITANIPEEIIEAAQIDGANHFQILPRIVVPLSKPIIATIGLMSGLMYWNNWQNGLYYIVKRTEFYSIQNVLNRMLENANFIRSEASRLGATQDLGEMPSAGIRMAIACLALYPILIIYPFIQKAFVRGIVVGGVKG